MEASPEKKGTTTPSPLSLLHGSLLRLTLPLWEGTGVVNFPYSASLECSPHSTTLCIFPPIASTVLHADGISVI